LFQGRDEAIQDVKELIHDLGIDYVKGDFLKPAKLDPVKIETIDEEPPPPMKQYRYSPAMKKVIDEEIQKQLAQGVIRPSKSEWLGRLVLVRKKDGTWRVCKDERVLNSKTKRFHYPLPFIEELLDGVKGAKVISVIDLASAFWQIELEEDSARKTAFMVPAGNFEWCRLPQGWLNSPAIFQYLMEAKVLKDTKAKVYIDDILVVSETVEQHHKDLRVCD